MYNNGDIRLRRLVGADASILLKWENNEANWRVSDRKEPLTLQDIATFIESQDAAPFQLDQIRYMILESKTGKCIGTIDLYEMDWEKDSAHVGILIATEKYRKKRAAFYALQQLLNMASEELELERLLARVQHDNLASQKLFIKTGFRKKIEDLDPKDTDARYTDCDIFERWLNE